MLTKRFLPALAIAGLSPLAALALPSVGDVIGTEPDAARAALEKAGCMVDAFEAEDGMIEAKCKDAATGHDMEIYLDPASGKVVRIKDEG
jgi:hypothetical protein